MPETTTAVLDQPATTTSEPSTTTEPAATSTPGIDPSGQPPSQESQKAGDATLETADESPSTDLLSAEEYAKVKDDPKQLQKALNKAFTQKTQQLASQRKALGSWDKVRESYGKDAKATLTELAKQAGLEIRDPKEEAAKATTVDAGKKAVEKVNAVLAKAGLEELSDELVAVFREIAEEAAGKATAPVRQHQDEVIRESIARESAAVLESFGKTHPDWQEHEEQMTDLMGKFPPPVDPTTGQRVMADADYLDHIYDLATRGLRDKRVTDATKKAADEAVERLRKSAANAEPRTTGVTGDKVVTSAPAKAGFKQAAEAAKRGERWE